MNKIVYCCFATIALLVLASCASLHTNGAANNGVPFRINMGLGFGPHSPAVPAPPAPATQWTDVGNWQIFLVSKGFLPAGKFVTNTFDAATASATKAFQNASALPATGCVNLATYQKAVQEGLAHYKPVRVSNSCAATPRHTMKRALGATLTTGDSFRDNVMAIGCADTAGWYDVADWQTFLIANGYLMAGTTYPNGQFDSPTQTATTKFQMAWSLSPTGTVNEKTYAFAISTTFANDGGAILVSHNGVTPTVEDKIGCN